MTDKQQKEYINWCIRWCLRMYPFSFIDMNYGGVVLKDKLLNPLFLIYLQHKNSDGDLSEEQINRLVDEVDFSMKKIFSNKFKLCFGNKTEYKNYLGYKIAVFLQKRYLNKK